MLCSSRLATGSLLDACCASCAPITAQSLVQDGEGKPGQPQSTVIIEDVTHAEDGKTQVRDIVASLLAHKPPGTSTRLTLILCVQQTDTEMAVQTGDEVKVLKSVKTEQKQTDATPGTKTRTVMVQKDASDVAKQAAANKVAAAAAADLAQAMEEDDTVSTLLPLALSIVHIVHHHFRHHPAIQSDSL